MRWLEWLAQVECLMQITWLFESKYSITLNYHHEDNFTLYRQSVKIMQQISNAMITYSDVDDNTSQICFTLAIVDRAISWLHHTAKNFNSLIYSYADDAACNCVGCITCKTATVVEEGPYMVIARFTILLLTWSSKDNIRVQINA